MIYYISELNLSNTQRDGFVSKLNRLDRDRYEEDLGMGMTKSILETGSFQDKITYRWGKYRHMIENDPALEHQLQEKFEDAFLTLQRKYPDITLETLRTDVALYEIPWSEINPILLFRSAEEEKNALYLEKAMELIINDKYPELNPPFSTWVTKQGYQENVGTMSRQEKITMIRKYFSDQGYFVNFAAGYGGSFLLSAISAGSVRLHDYETPMADFFGDRISGKMWEVPLQLIGNDHPAGAYDNKAIILSLSGLKNIFDSLQKQGYYTQVTWDQFVAMTKVNELTHFINDKLYGEVLYNNMMIPNMFYAEAQQRWETINAKDLQNPNIKNIYGAPPKEYCVPVSYLNEFLSNASMIHYEYEETGKPHRFFYDLGQALLSKIFVDTYREDPASPLGISPSFTYLPKEPREAVDDYPLEHFIPLSAEERAEPDRYAYTHQFAYALFIHIIKKNHCDIYDKRTELYNEPNVKYTNAPPSKTPLYQRVIEFSKTLQHRFTCNDFKEINVAYMTHGQEILKLLDTKKSTLNTPTNRK